MKNKIFVMAALAATALFTASCQKETGNGNGQEGAAAKMGLSISFPKSAQTRAVNANATAQDMIVTSIDVFIFNPDGTAADGNNVAEIGQFTVNTDGDTWTLDDANLISTTSGDKKIYVGINLPDGLKDAASESTLTDAFNGVNALYSNTDATRGVAMLSKAFAKKIVPTASGTNEVTIPVMRMPAKVTATMVDGFSTTPTAVTDPTFTVSPDMFTIGNTALSVYPVQRMNGSTLVTPGDVNNQKPSVYKPVNNLDTIANPQVPINPYGTANNVKNGRYVPEHSTSTLWLRGESTYAVVRGELKPAFYTTVESNTIVETTPAPATFENPVWVVNYAGRVYFTESIDDRTDIIAKLGLPNNGAAHIQEYKPKNGKLYTFYHVFIAQNAADKLAVHRNNIYDVIVNSVKSIGQPGDPAIPSNPDEPVYELPSNLDVEVVIEDWTYNSELTDLK